jgi:UDP-glucose 4-epimerase
MLLVTGGAGYVGSQFVCDAVGRSTDAVVVVDNLSEGHREALPQGAVKLVECSIGDQDALDKVFAEHDIDVVVHFAANAYVGESQEKPFKYFQNNVVQSIKLFECMERHAVRKIVFSSSCATYGVPDYVPIDEDHPQRPVNVYGTTKLIVEQVLQSLAEAKNWSSVSLRYFNAAGDASNGRFGESHDPETHLIPLVLQAAAGKNKDLRVFGDDYDTADGTCIRDYIHVSDLSAAHLSAVDLVRSETVCEHINLGTGRGASVLDVIKLAREITGRDITYKVFGRRPGDPPALVASADKAARLLGWQPQHDLKDIISTAWDWERRRS